jgi:hypothetical protein
MLFQLRKKLLLKTIVMKIFPYLFLLLNCILQKHSPILLVSFLIILASSCSSTNDTSYEHWEVYGGTPECIRYSSLTAVDAVSGKQKWVYIKYLSKYT